MAIIKKEDIRGINTAEGIICADCMTDEEWNEMEQDEIITADDIENDDRVYFCDRNGKQL